MLLHLVIIDGHYNAYKSGLVVSEFVWRICNASFIFHERRNYVFIGLTKYTNVKENWIDMYCIRVLRVKYEYYAAIPAPFPLISVHIIVI